MVCSAHAHVSVCVCVRVCVCVCVWQLCTHMCMCPNVETIKSSQAKPSQQRKSTYLAAPKDENGSFVLDRVPVCRISVPFKHLRPSRHALQRLHLIVQLNGQALRHDKNRKQLAAFVGDMYQPGDAVPQGPWGDG